VIAAAGIASTNTLESVLAGTITVALLSAVAGRHALVELWADVRATQTIKRGLKAGPPEITAGTAPPTDLAPPHLGHAA
jgi:hypothetical protein